MTHRLPRIGASRRSFLMGSSMAALGLGLTACGRADSTASVAASASATVSSGPATGDLTFWAGSPDGDTLKTFLKPFTEANPDLNLKITTIPSDDMDTKVTAAIASGKVPDMVMLYSQTQASMLATGTFASVPTGSIDTSAFFTPTQEGVQVDGVFKAVPWYAYGRACYYRKDIVEDELGLTVPTTWDENLTFLQGMVDGGYKTPLGLSVAWDEYTAEMFVEYLAQNDGSVISDDNSTWTINSDAAVETLEYIGKLFTSGYASPDGPLFLDTVPWITTGKTLVNINGPWLPGWLDEAKSDGWAAEHMGSFEMPAGPNGTVASALGSGSLGVFADSENTDAAWKLIQYMSEPDVQVDWYENFGNLPAVSSAWDDPAIADDEMLTAVRDIMEDTFTMPGVSTWSRVAAVIGEQMEKVARGKATAQDALDEAQSQAESIGTGN